MGDAVVSNACNVEAATQEHDFTILLGWCLWVIMMLAIGILVMLQRQERRQDELLRLALKELESIDDARVL